MTDAPISFDDAHAPATSVPCSRCERPLTEYWTLDGAVLCESCAETLRQERTSSEGALRRVGKAFAFGVGGMLAGAAVWYAVARIANLEIGLIAILLGWLVGKGIYLGSGKRGGRGYQVMAVLLTYLGIGVAGVPFAIEGWNEAQRLAVDSLAVADTTSSTPVTQLPDSQLDAELIRLDSAIAAGKELDTEAVPGIFGALIGIGALVVLALMVPVLSIIGGQSIIGVLIYGFALWEAWKLAAATLPEISGPHPVGGAPS
jgi:hypothetical protein